MYFWTFWRCVSSAGVAFTILMLLASLNSCTNPWIYTAFSSSVSRELQNLLHCGSRSGRRGSLPDDSTTTHTSTTKDSLYWQRLMSWRARHTETCSKGMHGCTRARCEDVLLHTTLLTSPPPASQPENALWRPPPDVFSIKGQLSSHQDFYL